MREHLTHAGAVAELEPPVEFPWLMEHVWTAFIELNSARPAGGMGPGGITYEGIQAWMSVTGKRLAGWEVDAVKKLDAAWMQVQSQWSG